MNKIAKRKFIKQKKRCKEIKARGQSRNYTCIKPISSKEAYYRMEANWPPNTKTLGIRKRVAIAYNAFIDKLRGKEYCVCRFPGDISDRIVIRIRR